jgi:hypothetical protein
MLADLLEDGEIGDTLPEAARPMFAMMVDMPPCHEHAVGEVVPVRELPYGPAAYRCITGRTDGSIRLRARTPENRLHPKGRPQMDSGTAASGAHGGKQTVVHAERRIVSAHDGRLALTCDLP